MPHPSLPISHLRSAETNDQCAPKYESQSRRLGVPFIDILDDDSLLSIFSFYRPPFLDEDENDDSRILKGGEWSHERWWYRLAQVCRRWRNLVFASAAYLNLSRVCSYGTPVEDLLAYSPPLPLTMDYVDKSRNIMGNEEAISIGLRHHDRIRRIRFYAHAFNLKKLVAAMDGEFPMLEYLYIEPRIKDGDVLVLPQTFQASHLRHLVLSSVFLTIKSPLLTEGLVTFWLQEIPSSLSAYFSPRDLLTQLSLMPHLETLGIEFRSTSHNDNKMSHSSVVVPTTLSRLRWFMFGGASTYLEALLPSMTTPLLEKVGIFPHQQPTFVVTPSLLQFMSTSKNLRFGSAKFDFFENGVSLNVHPYEGAKQYALGMYVRCGLLAPHVPSVAQICNVLSPVLSSVVDLTLDDRTQSPRLTEHAQWRIILGAFNGVKTLHVGSALVFPVSRSLRLDDGEPTPTPELLPELQELSYYSTSDASDPFAAFINARQNSGRPVNLIRR